NYLDRRLRLEVVGVVADIKQSALRDSPGVEIYVPYLQTPWMSSSLLVRTTGDTAAVSTAVQRALWDLNRSRALPEVKPISDMLAESVAEPRFYAWLLGAFAIVALGLVAIGVYGITSHSVAERTREIGIKMALGAAFGSIIRQVIGQSAALAATGIAVGLAGALAMTRLLSSLLYGVRSTDAATFITISAVLGLVALFAGLVPARRAARLDPVIALRHE